MCAGLSRLGWWVGWLSVWLVGWVLVWLFVWLVGWLVGWMGGWVFCIQLEWGVRLFLQRLDVAIVLLMVFMIWILQPCSAPACAAGHPLWFSSEPLEPLGGQVAFENIGRASPRAGRWHLKTSVERAPVGGQVAFESISRASSEPAEKRTSWVVAGWAPWNRRVR